MRSPSSNWRAKESLAGSLRAQDKPALAGVDTRALTSLLRDRGTLKGFLSVCGAVDEAAAVERARRRQEGDS